MNVRQATCDDIPALSVIGLRFASAVPHGEELIPSCEDISASIESFISAGGVVFMAENGDKLYGVLAAVAAPVWYSPGSLVASEQGWWVSPEYRGGRAALALIDAYEKWARDIVAKGLTLCLMTGSMEEKLHDLYLRRGYAEVERTYYKKL